MNPISTTPRCTFLQIHDLMDAYAQSNERGMQQLQSLSPETQKKLFEKYLGVETDITVETLKKCLHDKVLLKLQKAGAAVQKQQQAEFTDDNFAKGSSTKINKAVVESGTVVDSSTNPVFSRISHKNIGFAMTQGRRGKMEDKHLITKIESPVCAEIYAVFDGHRGSSTAQYLTQNFAMELQAALEKYNEREVSEIGIYAACKEAFINLDAHYQGNDGSTACVVVIIDHYLYIANVGDSRAIWANGGQPIQLSEDQKCNNPEYAKRVIKLGGTIQTKHNCSRVDGKLATPRSIGDHAYSLDGIKYVSPIPKITTFDLNNRAENGAIVIGSDGLWDVCATTQAAEFVQRKFTHSPATIAKGLVTKAFNGGTTDNVTVLVVKL